jgi:hypothetical protein
MVIKPLRNKNGRHAYYNTDNFQKECVLISKILKLIKVISGYKQVFAEDPKATGHIDPQVAEHIIDTGINLPINMGPRRSSPAQRNCA